MKRLAITAEELSYIILATENEERKKELILEQKKVLSIDRQIKDGIKKIKDSLSSINNDINYYSASFTSHFAEEQDRLICLAEEELKKINNNDHFIYYFNENKNLLEKLNELRNKIISFFEDVDPNLNYNELDLDARQDKISYFIDIGKYL